jgi:hypothetical protein
LVVMGKDSMYKYLDWWGTRSTVMAWRPPCSMEPISNSWRYEKRLLYWGRTVTPRYFGQGQTRSAAEDGWEGKVT